MCSFAWECFDCVSSHVIIVLRKLSELNCLAKSDLKVVASKASCFFISVLSHKGQYLLLSVSLKLLTNMLSHWQCKSKPCNVCRPRQAYCLEQKNFTTNKKFLTAISTMAVHIFSPIKLIYSQTLLKETSLVTCFKCNNNGHCADSHPEWWVNPFSTASVSQQVPQNKTTSRSPKSSTSTRNMPLSFYEGSELDNCDVKAFINPQIMAHLQRGRCFRSTPKKCSDMT